MFLSYSVSLFAMGMKDLDTTCYVLHVKQGYGDREKSIVQQFSKLGQPFEWILDHDKEDITPQLLEAYGYSGHLNLAAVSCSLKHIRAWERIAHGKTSGGFVFEDDVVIDLEQFHDISRKLLEEYHACWPGCGYISLGSGCALYVPWTKRCKNKLLYPAQHVRATDSYWINRETAVKMVDWIRNYGFDQPADHLIDLITTALGIPIFWLDPTIVDQGSHTGLFKSSIQDLERGNIVDQLGWRIKVLRRKFLYPLMGIDLTKK